MKPSWLKSTGLDPRVTAAFGYVLGLVMQAALFPGLLPKGPSLEPMFTFVATLAILGHKWPAYALALLGGLSLDALGGQMVGISALQYLAVAAGITLIQKNLVKEALVAPAAVMLVTFVVKEIIGLFVLVSIGMRFLPLRVAVQLTVSSLLNACFGTVVYWLLHFRLGLSLRIDRGY